MEKQRNLAEKKSKKGNDEQTETDAEQFLQDLCVADFEPDEEGDETATEEESADSETGTDDDA